MRLETEEAVKNQWNHCSISSQKELIRRYLKLYGKSDKGAWLEFLAREFGLDRSGQDGLKFR
ncbi:MAG: hypothetical protein D6B25_06940 [Desulfobulbaceae bacterium]|nr:MAG: hypothetical protein D6B25_06940 [Desulfobulbaceae bacterium]